MLTRGRHANHAWLQVNDSETHLAPVDADLLQPDTATRLLEAVIGRDDAPASATTLLRQADQPDLLLGPAATCYLDAIGFAAEHHLPQHIKDAIDTAGKQHGLTEADAWPTLRNDLMLIAANGLDPTDVLSRAVALDRLDGARDPAAVIDYRLDLTQANNRTRGPLPWLPGIPTQLLDDPYWKTYLSDRYKLTRQLGQETRQAAETVETPPRWAEHLPRLDPALLADIEVWRAANQIPDTDLRPTGPPAYAPAEHDTQRHLNHRLETAQTGIREWAPRITDAAPEVAGDPRLAILAARLATLSRKRADVPELLTQAAAQGHLPDDHPADALGYRITTLTKKTARHDEPWETITPGDLERRRHHQPPSMQPPGHRPGIGI
jgi:hypothetical protein